MIGSLGVPELLFILALALLIFGPRKLPEIGRTMGRAMSEFRKASTEIQRALNTEVLEEEIRREREQLNEALRGDDPGGGSASGAKPEVSAAESDTSQDARSEEESPALTTTTPTTTVARGSRLSEDES